VVDGQSLDRAVAAFQVEPAGKVCDLAPIQHDERLAAEAGLSGAVDHDGAGDRRQCRLQVERLHPRPRNGEADRVRRRQGALNLKLGRRAQGRDRERAVTDFDRLPERQRRIRQVIRVGHRVHGERRQEPPSFKSLDTRPSRAGASRSGAPRRGNDWPSHRRELLDVTREKRMCRILLKKTRSIFSRIASLTDQIAL
jgi:hypothetical protein